MIVTEPRTFKRKNNLYYISLLVYAVFLVVYILFTATITDETIQFGFRDPVIYIIGIFILHAVVMLCINIVRNQRLIVTSDSIILRTRYNERVIRIALITRISIKREQRKFNDGAFAVIKIRVQNRRRWLRIRAANWDRENEVYQIFVDLKHSLKK